MWRNAQWKEKQPLGCFASGQNLDMDQNSGHSINATAYRYTFKLSERNKYEEKKMVWYLTLNPNIIVIQHIFLLLCSSMIFRWFVVVRCRSMLFVQESGGTKIEVYFPPFIFIIVIIVPSLRWVDLVCVCVYEFVCGSTTHSYTLFMIIMFCCVCVCVSVVRIALFVDYTMNSLRPNAMHWQKKK